MKEHINTQDGATYVTQYSNHEQHILTVQCMMGNHSEYHRKML